MPILALGGIFDTINNQLLLRQAMKWGVTYWDTAESYNRTKSEQGMGIYIGTHSDERKKMFLVTKASYRRSGVDTRDLTRRLNASLERLQTDYVDLYFLHALRDPAVLNGEVKAWAERMKREKKIKFFGFSTHQNMAEHLKAAAKAGWIDGIMVKYDYRIAEQLKPAVEAAAKAGIGLTAMKTQAGRQRRGEGKTKPKLLEKFLEKGFTDFQAKLKAVWECEQMATLCSQMPNLTILSANVAAALDKAKLTEEDKKQMARHARETCSGYCAGCTAICESALAGAAPIGDVMRCLMYYHSYGDRDRARETFHELPARVRKELARLDYSKAERRCQQHMPIAALMKEAAEILA